MTKVFITFQKKGPVYIFSATMYLNFCMTSSQIPKNEERAKFYFFKTRQSKILVNHLHVLTTLFLIFIAIHLVHYRIMLFYRKGTADSEGI
jgi:hypothetical protein